MMTTSIRIRRIRQAIRPPRREVQRRDAYRRDRLSSVAGPSPVGSTRSMPARTAPAPLQRRAPALRPRLRLVVSNRHPIARAPGAPPTLRVVPPRARPMAPVIGIRLRAAAVPAPASTSPRQIVAALALAVAGLVALAMSLREIVSGAL